MRKGYTGLLVILGLWLAISAGLVDMVIGGLLNGVAEEAGRLAGPIEVVLIALAVPVALTGVGIAVLWRSKRRRGLELILGAVVMVASAQLANVGLRLLESSLHRMGDELTRSLPR